MTPVRTPDVVRDVPGLLTYGMPVTFTAEGLDGERIECTGVVLDTPEPNTTWRVANLTDGVPADLYGDETRDMCPDWSSPLAIYAALHWLADRGHICTWMLPATHGGKVTAHDGLTAWEVSAILVARSVVRVARGDRPVDDLYRSEDLRRHTAWSTQSGFTVHWTKADRISKTWAFAAPGGILLPD